MTYRFVPVVLHELSRKVLTLKTGTVRGPLNEAFAARSDRR